MLPRSDVVGAVFFGGPLRAAATACALRSARREVTGGELPQAGGGNHRGVVGRQVRARQEHRQPGALAAARARWPQKRSSPRRRRRCQPPARCATSPRQTCARPACRRPSPESSPRDQRTSCVGQALDAERGLPLAHVTQHRRLQSAEAEVEAIFARRRVAIGMRQPGRRQRDRVRVASVRPADR